MSSNTSPSEISSSNTCANCGKEGSDVTNTCNKCNTVMYCNAACKKKHRSKHKKECEEYQRRAAELHDEKLFKQPPPLDDCPHKHKKQCEEYARQAAEHEAELHDKKLFKEPPPDEDCPICFIRLPYLETGLRYQSCCGKAICSGCAHAPVYDNQGNQVAGKACPFCRSPVPLFLLATTKL